MLIFSSVTMQNFLQVGNSPITINLNTHQTTLIVGPNGSGKSQLVTDSLAFALYNKAYRDINKNQLINSINGKACLVTVEFACNGIGYKVVRGMKPAIFEIYENGKLINQDPNVRDYQKVLEQQILKMNYRAFTQIVVMGSASYVPFMKLKPNERREFIEDLLDIRVFSVMKSIFSEQNKDELKSIELIDKDIKTIRSKAELQRGFVEKMRRESLDSIDGLQTQIEEKIAVVEKATKNLDDICLELDTKTKQYERVNHIYDRFSRLKLEAARYNEERKSLLEEIDANKQLKVCPVCDQPIDENHINHMTKRLNEKLEGVESRISATNAEIAQIPSNIEEIIETLRVRISDLKASQANENGIIKSTNDMIAGFRSTIDVVSKVKSIEEEEAKLALFIEEATLKLKDRRELETTNQYTQASIAILQDSGIKQKVIKQYVPVINKLLNEYLDLMNFFVQFTIDESFNEKILSRHRDLFSYSSFSEGQKFRINLAFIFAWREVAKMKNSVNCNLLIADELFDSSLDAEVLDTVLEMVQTLKGTNVFVISHRTGIADKFSNVIEVSTKSNFTVIN